MNFSIFLGALVVPVFVITAQASPHKKLSGEVGPLADNSDAKLSTPELLEKYGYPCETHKVTTQDGYILTLHRIPNGKNAPPAPPEGRPVVWVQHGLLCSSSDWLMNTVDKALAYRLADQGYDVWLGNARGNTYSREHVNYTTKDAEFWDFSWDEMGEFDLPANFDYVLGLTGQAKLFYIGHSMGTTMFFTCMSLRPEYNDKIRLMSALAPVAFMEHMESPIGLIAPFADILEWILSHMGIHEFLPNSALMEFLGLTICHQLSPIQELCSNIIFLACGYDSAQLNRTMLPVIIAHTPAGASVKSVVHYAQGHNNKRFCRYNNSEDYDLSKITAPVAFYYSDNDWLAATQDVWKLAEMMPNIVRKELVPLPKFNHLDFTWAVDAPALLYESVENFMKKF